MWRFILFAGAILGGAAPGYAQQQRGSLLAASGWVRFQVVYGRLHAIPQHSQVRKTAETTNPLRRTYQSHAVAIEGSHVDVEYTLETPDEFMEVRYQPNGMLKLTHERTDESCFRLSLKQAPHASDDSQHGLKLEIEHQGTRRTLAAANLWSLALREPRVFDEHVAPVLERICPAMRPTSLRKRIVQELYALSEEDRPCRLRVTSLVEQLGAQRFPTRQAAERQLKLLGPGVLPLLNTIPQRHLDTEQRVRMKRVRQHYRQPYADCCERIAAWLASFNDTWIALLDDARPENRRRAFAALCQNCGKSSEKFQFRANAPAKSLRQQINQLQSQLVKN